MVALPAILQHRGIEDQTMLVTVDYRDLYKVVVNLIRRCGLNLLLLNLRRGLLWREFLFELLLGNELLNLLFTCFPDFRVSLCSQLCFDLFVDWELE